MNPNHQFTDRLNLEEVWPDLFEGMTQEQRRQVVQTLAYIWHEGWVPTREAVKNFIDKSLGLIDSDEYARRSQARAERKYPSRVTV